MAHEPESSEPIRLTRRDRFVFAYRLGSTIPGLALMAWATATSSWGPWTIGLIPVIIVGGGITYHLLTSITRCPNCSERMINLAITSPETRRKVFQCPHCGTTAYLTEGFYWQTDTAG